MLLIINGIDIFHFSGYEQQTVFDNFATATAALKFPHKYVFTEQSPSLSAPYAALNHKRSRSSSPYITQLIQRDMQRIRNLEHNQSDKIAYLEIFCDSKNKISQMKASVANYISYMSDTNVRLCTKSEAIDFLQTRLRYSLKHNDDIFPQIVKESEAYINVDGQYITSLRVFGYPAYIDNLLFASLFYLSDAVVTLDVDMMDKNTILYTIKKEYVKAMKSDKDLSSCNKLISSLANVFTDNPQSDPIWPDSARQLLIAMILYLIEYAYPRDELDKVNMYTVYNFFIEFGSYNVPKKVNGINTMINALDEVFKSLPIGNLAKAAYATSKFSSGDTRSSIFTTLASNINIFGADMGVSKLTSANQIDFSALLNPDEPCAIFMVVPDEEVSRHVIASLFVNQCYNFLVGESRKYEGNKLPVRTHFILDEFGNMPSIPAMDNKITVSAGRNILFDLAIQDFNQLEAKYKGTAKTIRSNMGNIVYINSLDKDTNEYISAILGDETIEYHTYSGKLSELESHQNLNIDKKTLMSATQLSRLEFGEAVIKRQRCYPIRTKFTPFYKLNAKVTRIDEIPLAIDKRSLKESMLSFDEIWKSIQLEGPTSVDKTAAARPVSPKSTANNDLTEKHNRAWLDCDTASHGEFLKLINAEDYKGAFKVLEKCSKLKRLQYEDTYSIIVAELTQLFNN